MNRHEQRVKAFQILFQIDKEVVSLTDAKFYDYYEENSFIKSLINYILNHQTEIDEKISSALTNYTLNRVNKVERNVLRIAIGEMLSTDIPKKVAINEAIRISKNYGDIDSYKFVNGVLKNFLTNE